MEPVPFTAVSSTQLDNAEYLEETTTCPECGELHVVKHSTPSPILQFVKCNTGNVYLVGINSKKI